MHYGLRVADYDIARLEESLWYDGFQAQAWFAGAIETLIDPEEQLY